MDYIAVTFSIVPMNVSVSDVLATILAESGFESFDEQAEGMIAYVSAKNFHQSALTETVPNTLYGSTIAYTWLVIQGQDWNHEWEKNYFKPIVINQQCVIHSSFHTDYPIARWDIVIDPKMAFGTGHHETTSLMLEYLLEMDVTNQSFLDMGCGTAVLAILASLKGAQPVLGIDIDEWACQNATENTQLNATQAVEILAGDAQLLVGRNPFALIFANINRNILLADMELYVNVLETNGFLFMSGFYLEDLELIRTKAESLGLRYLNHRSKNNWCACKFTSLFV